MISKCADGQMYNLDRDRCETLDVPTGGNLRIRIGGDYFVGSVESINRTINLYYGDRYDAECQTTPEGLESKRSMLLSELEEETGQNILSFEDLGSSEVLCVTAEELFNHWDYRNVYRGFKVPQNIDDDIDILGSQYTRFVNFPIWSNKYITKEQADNAFENENTYLYVIAPTQYNFVEYESTSQSLASPQTLYHLVPVGYSRAEREYRPRLLRPIWGMVSEFASSQTDLREVYRFQMDRVRSISFNSSGEYLGAGKTSLRPRIVSENVQVWNLETGQRHTGLNIESVDRILFHPVDNNLLAIVTPRQISLRDISNWEELQSFQTPARARPRSIAFSGTQDWLYVHAGGQVLVWDIVTGVLLRPFGMNILKMSVWNDLVATVGDNGDLIFWRMTTDTRQQIHTITLPDVDDVAWVTSANNRAVTALNNEDTLEYILQVWEMSSGELIAETTAEGMFRNFALSPDGELLVIGVELPNEADRRQKVVMIRILSVSNLTTLYEFETEIQHAPGRSIEIDFNPAIRPSGSVIHYQFAFTLAHARARVRDIVVYDIYRERYGF